MVEYICHMSFRMTMPCWRQLPLVPYHNQLDLAMCTYRSQLNAAMCPYWDHSYATTCPARGERKGLTHFWFCDEILCSFFFAFSVAFNDIKTSNILQIFKGLHTKKFWFSDCWYAWCDDAPIWKTFNMWSSIWVYSNVTMHWYARPLICHRRYG